MKINKKGIFMIVGYIVLLAITLALVLKVGITPKKEKEKIGFIMTGSISDSGWNAMNYQGVEGAAQKLGVELLVKENIPEGNGSCPVAVQELVKEGAGMIILNSYGYSKEMKEHLEEYPNVVFYGAAADYEADNLTTYSSRMYQARYLSGIVAAYATNTEKIGYVAADNKPEVCRGINAFALGIQRVKPEAQVIVAWSGSWDNREIETAAADALIQQEGVDVITYHQDKSYVSEAAEKAGVASIGYYEALEGASDNYLTCAICEWQPLYESIIEAYLRGQGNRVHTDWMGLESGVIRLTDYSPKVSEEARMEVEKAKDEIISGKDVFCGDIYDNEGNQRCAEGEAISDETLINNMDWLVEGVRIYEK